MADIKNFDLFTTGVGAAAGAAGGAALSWFWNKWFAKKKKLSTWKAALVGAGIGGAGGALYSIFKKPHTIEDVAKLYRDGVETDPYYHEILVGGAGAGGTGLKGVSALPFGFLSKAKNKDVFRHDQVEEIENRIRKLIAEGKHPRVWGHSWGGAAIAGLAPKFKDVKFHALDPVSWTGIPDRLPDNLTIYRPTETGFLDELVTSGPLTALATHLGHRWPIRAEGGRYVSYRGDHVSGIENAIAEAHDLDFMQRDPKAFNDFNERWLKRLNNENRKMIEDIKDLIKARTDFHRKKYPDKLRAMVGADDRHKMR